LAQSLERAGYRVIFASDGAEAVRLMNQTVEPVDLAILDVVMPELGGPEAWEQIRAARPHMRVLFASGYADNRYGARLPEGAQLLEKPFRIDELLRRIRQVLERRGEV
jgi:two-component system cell cycle sensor histidine kinase/response regulator CckA